MIGVGLAAGGILGATWVGALLGARWGDAGARGTGAAAGIMLCAAVFGLVEPSVSMCDGNGLPACVGLILGGCFLVAVKSGARRLLGQRLTPGQLGAGLFVLALAVHHFPEGLAAGVSFGTGDVGDAAAVCLGIALQNLPEAMIVMPAMISAGAGTRGGYLAAGAGAAMEILGLVLGAWAVTLVQAALPVLLALAAGTMLLVILEDMLPQSRPWAVLGGFCLMLVLSGLL